MDIKKLCSSQDPVKRNSRCALFQIINYCNYTHYTYYVFTSRFVSILASQITCGRTHDSMDDQFHPAMRAGWLSYIRNTYPDGVATAGPAVGQGTLIVVQLLLLLVRLFSAMNILQNSNFEIWNKVYNSTNNSYNSKIIAIIVSKYAKNSTPGNDDGFILGSSASCIKLDHCTLRCSVHCKLGATQILNKHSK